MTRAGKGVVMVTATAFWPLTLGQAATRLKVQLWMVQRVIDRRLVEAPAKVGRNRVVTEDDLPALRTALVVAGYLPAEPAVGAESAVAKRQ